LGVFTGAFFLGLYAEFASRFAIVRWEPDAVTPWVLAFLLTDLCYYLFHRASHRVALFWAIHAVHHQSEEMNLSVALRQTWFSDFTAVFFFWPLPLLGIPRESFFVAVAVLSSYEALQHTVLVRGGGLWGLIFNTPATHRLHHARDPIYRDRNYASTLVVWDRLFGTFVREIHAPTYGTVEPFRSWSPLRAQFAPMRALAQRLVRAPRLRDRLEILVRPPEWRAPGEAPSEGLVLAPRWSPGVPAPRVAAYALVQSLLVLAGGLYAIAHAGEMSLAHFALCSLLIALACEVSATLLERSANAQSGSARPDVADADRACRT